MASGVPAGGRLVSSNYGQPFAHMRQPAGDKDSDFKKFKTPTSNNSGKTFWRRKGPGDDGHDDVYQYKRSIITRPVMSNNRGPFGMFPQQARDTGPFNTGTGQLLYSQSINYKEAGRLAGSSKNGDRQPEKAKRANDPRLGGSSTKQNKSNRRSSTILTGPRGKLGGSTTTKSLLGA